MAQGLAKDEALRQAKLDFLEKANFVNAHPYFWGSFVVIGDIEPVTGKESWKYWLMGFGLLILLAVSIMLVKSKRSA